MENSIKKVPKAGETLVQWKKIQPFCQGPLKQFYTKTWFGEKAALTLAALTFVQNTPAIFSLRPGCFVFI